MAYDNQGFLLSAQPPAIGAGNPRCIKGLNYLGVERTCAANGARMCFQHELRDKLSKVGCTAEYSGTRIVTASECDLANNPAGTGIAQASRFDTS
jgi:hypothetical protein